jgi:hypothetical protein
VNVSYNGGFYLQSVANALINFNNPYNYNFGGTQTVYGASVAASDFVNGLYGGNDPVRFGGGRLLSYGASIGFQYMNSYRGTNQDIFNKNFFYSVSSSGNYSLYSGTYGYWGAGQRGFLLFQFFASGGNTHFGYFDLSIAPNGESLRIHGWAFNDTPGGAVSTIALPSPGTVGLGALAMGAAGIRRHRREAVKA